MGHFRRYCLGWQRSSAYTNLGMLLLAFWVTKGMHSRRSQPKGLKWGYEVDQVGLRIPMLPCFAGDVPKLPWLRKMEENYHSNVMGVSARVRELAWGCSGGAGSKCPLLNARSSASWEHGGKGRRLVESHGAKDGFVSATCCKILRVADMLQIVQVASAPSVPAPSPSLIGRQSPKKNTTESKQWPNPCGCSVCVLSRLRYQKAGAVQRQRCARQLHPGERAGIKGRPLPITQWSNTDLLTFWLSHFGPWLVKFPKGEALFPV